MRVRTISRDNGFGLSRDLAMIETALRDVGVEVQRLGLGGERLVDSLRQTWLRLAQRRSNAPDVQIFVERLYPRCLPLAPCNLLIPNPEWTRPESQPLLRQFAGVLCKTRHAVDIFDALGCTTRHIGFSSEDRLDAGIIREERFFHLAGRSDAKGTEPLLTAWRRHPEWPVLTIVQSAKTARPGSPAANIEHIVDRVDDASLQRMQNSHLFHICPSEAEGFGHYIMEALSVGAIVLTTDGAPMNELVTTERGLLIPPAQTGTIRLSPRYLVSAEAIEAAVEQALALDAARRESLSTAARRHFVDNDRAFRQRFVAAVSAFGGARG